MTGKCQTCLTRDRRLISTSNLEPILKEIKFEQLKKFKSICWECHMIILKFYNYKKQVYEAQTRLNKKVQTQTFSRLTQTTKNSYDYDFIHIETDVKIELEMVKQEMEYSDNVDNDNDERHVPVDNIDEKKIVDYVHNDHDYDRSKQELDINIKKRKLPVKDNSKEFAEKLEIVVLNEEDVQRIREEKRNNRNYKKNLYKCDTCIQGFYKKGGFDLHMKKNHDENIGPHTCPVCAMRFSTLTSLNEHHETHYQHYKCILCDHKMHALQTALNHIRDKHQGDDIDRIHCKHCDFIAKTRDELMEHYQNLHAFWCSICGGKFKEKGTLKTHIKRTHTSNRQFICEICKKTFVCKAWKESHMITNHSQSIAQQLSHYYCSKCKIQFKSIIAYRSHIKNSVNHTEKRFSCPLCNKKFLAKGFLNQHYNFSHLKQSQYKCELCDKIFRSKSHFQQHNQVHHGLSRSRDHACDLCHKKFYTSVLLKGHMLTHSDKRQFMCSDCGDTFKQSAALRTHCKLVHNSKIHSKMY